MARLRLDVTRALSELSDRLAQEVSRLESARQAVALETQELGRLHKIDVAATALDQMVRDYREQERALLSEIEAKRAAWAQEAEARERERKEQEQALATKRQREVDEYEYKKALERKKDKDRYEEECRVRDSQVREQKEALERSWQQREAALKEREEEFARLRKEAEDFPARLERDVKKAVAEARAGAQKEFEQQLVIMKKDGEAERRVAELQIQALKETSSKQLALIESLQRQLEEAKKQVQDIAVKAIEGASGSRALTHVNQIAMEQAKHRPPA
jgi:hypothetical protein